MPIYEYECRACGHLTVEYRHVHERRAAASCEKCASEDTALMIGRGVSSPRGGGGATSAPDEGSPASIPSGEHWNVTMTNCSAEGGSTALKIGPGMRVKADGFTARKVARGVDNSGVLHATGLDIEGNGPPGHQGTSPSSR